LIAGLCSGFEPGLQSEIAFDRGVTELKLKHFATAEKLFRRSLALIPENKRDSCFPSTANNLALTLQWQWRLKEAEPLFVEAFQIRRRTLGSNHDLTLGSMERLSDLYFLERRFKEATRLSEEILQLERKTYGTNDPRTAQSMFALAWNYEAMARHDDAESLYLESLNVFRREKKSDKTIKVLRKLMNLNDQRKKNLRAAEFYRQLVSAEREAQCSDCAQILIDANNLGYQYLGAGQNPAAARTFEEALRLSKTTLANESTMSRALIPACTMDGLGQTYHRLHRDADAEQVFKKALELRASTFGSDSDVAAETMIHLAQSYKTRKLYLKAEPLVVQALLTKQKALNQLETCTPTDDKQILELRRQSKGNFVRQITEVAKFLAEIRGAKHHQKRILDDVTLNQPTS